MTSFSAIFLIKITFSTPNHVIDSLLVYFFAKTVVTTVTTSVISTLNLLLKCFLIFFISRIVLSFSFSLLQKQQNKVVSSTIIIQKIAKRSCYFYSNNTITTIRKG